MDSYSQFEFQENSNQTDGVLGRFSKYLKHGKPSYFDVDEIEELANHFLSKNQIKKLQKVVDFGLELHPSSIEILLKKAEYMLANDNVKRCERLLNKLEAITQNNIDVILMKATVYSRMEDHVKAIEYYKKALKIDSSDDRQEILLEIAIEHENIKDYDKAIEILQKSQLEFPKQEVFAFELIYCYTVTEQMEKGVEFFQTFIDENPYLYHGWYNLGLCYSKLELFEKAAQAFDYCTIVEPTVSLAYFQKAFMLMEAELYNQAIEAFKDSMKVDDNKAMIYCYIGECYEKLDELEVAFGYYQEAIQINPEIPEGWIGLGVVRDLQGESISALPYIRKAIKLSPENEDYQLVMANTLAKANEEDSAMAIYQELLEEKPGSEEVILEYVDFLEQYVSNAEAEDALRHNIAKYPRMSILKTRLSAYLVKVGKVNEAIDIFTEVLNSQPDALDDFISFYPDAKDHPLLNELINSRSN